MKMDKACSDAGVRGFPTWVIDGKKLPGEQKLADIAARAGFEKFK